MKLVVIIIGCLISSQLLYAQKMDIKVVDSLFNKSIVVGNGVLIKLNNCSDTLLNEAMIYEIYSERNRFKDVYDLSEKNLKDFVCSSITDSSFLAEICDRIKREEKIDNKICFGGLFIERNKNIKLISLRIFSKKDHKRFLRRMAKIQRRGKEVLEKSLFLKLNNLYKRTSGYIIISTASGIHLIKCD